MKKILPLAVVFVISLFFGAAVARAQGNVKSGPDPTTIRDPELEKDSLHNLEVARQYFNLRKAYVASLERCEEIIAGNPAFSKIDEALFIAGKSNLYLADGKGRQKPSAYVRHEGQKAITLTAEQF